MSHENQSSWFRCTSYWTAPFLGDEFIRSFSGGTASQHARYKKHMANPMTFLLSLPPAQSNGSSWDQSPGEVSSLNLMDKSWFLHQANDIHIYDICIAYKQKIIYTWTHTQAKQEILVTKSTCASMSKHMLFLYAPTPCGKRTCSAFTEFCRTLESNLLLAASWCFENMDPHKQLGKVVESPGEMRIALPVCFFWDATIPVIDCSWASPHDFWRIWKILDYWTVDFILRNIK